VPRVLTTEDFITGVHCLRQLWYRLNGPEAAGAKAEDSAADGRNGSSHARGRGAVAAALHQAYQEDQHRRLASVAGFSAKPEVRACELTPKWRASARVDHLLGSASGQGLLFLRPATSVKDSFIWEAAFADHVVAQAGAGGGDVILRYLRKTYRRSPGDDYDGLLIDADVTRRARGRKLEVKSRLERMVELLDRVEPCRRRSCPVCAAGKSKVERLAELAPGSDLTPVQEIHLAARASGLPHVDRPAIAAFLEGLEYPLSFLDFEAYSEAVPSLPGTAPWEHVPVIYSLHRLERPGAAPEHHVYAAPPGQDGRAGLYRDLLSRLGERGSIVVYGKSFERRMLERLAAVAPVPAPPLESIIPRLADISRIFARAEYYDPGQQGSASLKAVYHAMIGGDYRDLEVADGRDANVLYYFLRHGFPAGEEIDGEAALEDLMRYCALDSKALVHIVEHLSSVM
jgi:hypothetical protein